MANAADQAGTVADARGLAHYADLTKLDLISHAGERVSVRGLFLDLTIQSSIFEPLMRGWIVLYDAVGLIDRLPIVGEETLEVEFATPGNDPKRMSFRVWKLTDVNPDDQGSSSTYRLHFVSAEAFRDAFTFVARSFTNTDDSASIVKTILTEYLQSGKQFNTTTMKDPAKLLVIPTYQPLEAIDMLIRRGYAGNQSKTDYFLFFERSDGFYLRMIDDLAAQPINRRLQGQGNPLPNEPGSTPDTPNKDVETYYAYASTKYLDDSTQGKDIRRIVTMQIHKRFDSLEKVSQGLYENEVVQYSLFRKRLDSVVYKFQQKKMLFFGGGEGPVPGTTKGLGNRAMNTDKFMSEFNTPATKFHGDQASKVFWRLNDPEEKEGVVKKSGGLFQSVRAALSQVQMSITVPGDSMVDVGDVVHVEVPVFASTTQTHRPDKFICGKWIIGSMRESILQPDKHVMVLDLFKDSFWQDVGEADFEDDGGTTN